MDVLALEELGDVVIVLEDGRTPARVHLGAQPTGSTREQRSQKNQQKGLQNRDDDFHVLSPPLLDQDGKDEEEHERGHDVHDVHAEVAALDALGLLSEP